MLVLSISSLAGFSSIFTQKRYSVASSLSFSGHSRAGLLCTGEEQKRLARGVFGTFAAHFSLLPDVSGAAGLTVVFSWHSNMSFLAKLDEKSSETLLCVCMFLLFVDAAHCASLPWFPFKHGQNCSLGVPVMF